ncbi:MAG: NAD(P)H-dependent oxidoreductase [Lysobacter sp.]|nr:NAD(P)H-dependent oxidoreductase [Lysobacter sp.]
MTRIFALSGSLRVASFNTALARAAQEHAPQDVQIEVGTLHGVPLYDGDLETRDGLPEAVLALKARILAADALLLVSPEYNNGVPGVMKNGIDWLSRADMKAVFGGRPIGIVGASMSGFGTITAQTAWLPTLKLLGGVVYSGGTMMLSRAQNAVDAQGRLTDESAQKALANYLSGFAAFVRAHAK